MDKNDFFIESIRNGNILKNKFVKSILSIASGDSLDMVKIVGNSFVYLDEEIEGDIKRALFLPNDTVKVPADIFKCRPEKFEDTVYNVILNYYIVERGLKGKYDYITSSFNFNDEMEKVIVSRLQNKEMEVSEVYFLSNHFLALRNLAKILIIPLTESTYYPPDWIGPYKKKKIKEYEDKYGANFHEDEILVHKLEEELMAAVKEYFKDDPTFGIAMDKKALKSYKKKYVSLGSGDTLTKDTEKVSILTSLTDEYPNTPKGIASIINTIIYGSEARGLGTIKGGVIAKAMLAGTHNIKITVEDCKTTDGFDFIIDEYYIVGMSSMSRVEKGKTIKNTVEYLNNNIGKKITLRVPAYCKAKGNHLCKICSGDSLSINEGGPALSASASAGDVVDHELSKFHDTSTTINKFTLKDLKI